LWPFENELLGMREFSRSLSSTPPFLAVALEGDIFSCDDGAKMGGFNSPLMGIIVAFVLYLLYSIA
jgi:hypothetical protein